MNPEDIAKVLDEIGERVGPLGSAAWDILVQGTRVVSAVGLLTGLALIGGSFVAFKLFWAKGDDLEKAYEARREWKWQTSDGAVFMHVLAWVTAIIMSVTGFVMAAYNAVGVFAPEFRVLENMLAALAGR